MRVFVVLALITLLIHIAAESSSESDNNDVVLAMKEAVGGGSESGGDVVVGSCTGICKVFQAQLVDARAENDELNGVIVKLEAEIDELKKQQQQRSAVATSNSSGDGGPMVSTPREGRLMTTSSEYTQAWTVQLGTSDTDSLEAMTVDSGDNVLMGGDTMGALTGSNAGDRDIWFGKYSSSGTQEWIMQIGTSSEDILDGMTVDSGDNVLVGGYTEGAFPGFTNAGEYDIWFGKYSSSGTQVWIVQFGTSGNDYLKALTVDSGDTVLVGGYTYGALTGSSNAGGRDIWFAKYSS